MQEAGMKTIYRQFWKPWLGAWKERSITTGTYDRVAPWLTAIWRKVWWAGVLCAIEVVKPCMITASFQFQAHWSCFICWRRGLAFYQGDFSVHVEFWGNWNRRIAAHRQRRYHSWKSIAWFLVVINKIQGIEYKPGSIFCFLELHIEQGPILDISNKPIGVVSGISDPLWLTV